MAKRSFNPVRALCIFCQFGNNFTIRTSYPPRPMPRRDAIDRPRYGQHELLPRSYPDRARNSTSTERSCRPSSDSEIRPAPTATTKALPPRLSQELFPTCRRLLGRVSSEANVICLGMIGLLDRSIPVYLIPVQIEVFQRTLYAISAKIN